ncbi:hypothetical protein R6G00_36610 [Streptomyces roseofulvus]|uniref:Uncharacterized protein n=2 Tax=Streptomyces TaxID=1883 RepID=A0ABU4KJ07_9ACTN|nr:hypothetical protein [Streptomyces roseolus]MDX2297687.1 hypothetical protein [Streptomyces roseolus]
MDGIAQHGRRHDGLPGCRRPDRGVGFHVPPYRLDRIGGRPGAQHPHAVEDLDHPAVQCEADVHKAQAGAAPVQCEPVVDVQDGELPQRLEGLDVPPLAQPRAHGRTGHAVTGENGGQGAEQRPDSAQVFESTTAQAREEDSWGVAQHVAETDHHGHAEVANRVLERGIFRGGAACPAGGAERGAGQRSQEQPQEQEDSGLIGEVRVEVHRVRGAPVKVR